MTRPTPDTREAYPYHLPIQTRWADVDRYGHINNSVYYLYFDTVVNTWLVERGVLSLEGDARIGLVVDTGCAFFAPADFPDTLTAGLRVAHVGRSSVRYEIGIFADGDSVEQDGTVAQGHFVHVYVDAGTRRPVMLDDAVRDILAELIT